MNAGTRLIFNANRREHVTLLRVPERITVKLGTLMFPCVNGTAAGYLLADLTRVADVLGRSGSLA